MWACELLRASRLRWLLLMLQQAGLCTLPCSHAADLPVMSGSCLRTVPASGVQTIGCTPWLLVQAATGCKTALPADDYNYKYFTFQIVLAFIMYLIGGCLCCAREHPISNGFSAGPCCNLFPNADAWAMIEPVCVSEHMM